MNTIEEIVDKVSWEVLQAQQSGLAAKIQELIEYGIDKATILIVVGKQAPKDSHVYQTIEGALTHLERERDATPEPQ